MKQETIRMSDNYYVTLKLELRVDNVTDAHRLRRILQRKSFAVPNEEVDFTITPKPSKEEK